MKVEKLGKLEIKVLNYIVLAKAPQPLNKIKEALGKKHNSEATQPINTLIDKEFLNKNEKAYKPKRGRPGAYYSLTEAGLSRYILEKEKNFGEELEFYKNMSPTVFDLNQIYKALYGHPRRDKIVLEGIYMVASLLGGGFSGEDIYVMGRAWYGRRFDKLAPGYKKRLLKIKAKTQGDYAKEVSKFVNKAKQ